MAGSDRLYSFDHGATTEGNVPNVEHRIDRHRVHPCSTRDVDQPRRKCRVSALLRGIDFGTAVPVVHGDQPFIRVRNLHLAIPAA